MHFHKDDLARLSADELRARCAQDPSYISELEDFDYTPLISACGIGNVEIVQALLDAGANPDHIAPDGVSALKMLIPVPDESFNPALFDLLLAAGANPNLGLDPPLHIAVSRGLESLVEFLVQHGANPNLLDADGEAPIFRAQSPKGWPDVKMMRCLIKLGADVTQRNGVGKSLDECFGQTALQEVLR